MQLNADKEFKELKSHGSFTFPVLVSEEVLAHYERGSFLWHWHPEIELTLIEDGEISYQVNQDIFHLHKGEGLFCNANALHTGHMIDSKNCYYTSVTFNPRVIYGYEGSIIWQKYMEPLISQTNMSAIHFKPDIAWHYKILKNLDKIHRLYTDKNDTYEFEIQQLLSNIILQIVKNTTSEYMNTRLKSGSKRDFERLKTILSYLNEHYMEKISLDSIAGEIGLCKEECCRYFKRYMNQTLFDYITSLRVEKSLSMLMENKLSMTEIAEHVGFASSSYYSKVFKKLLKCSPLQYRKANLFS